MSLDHLKDSSVVTENDLDVLAVIQKTADDYMNISLMIKPMVIKGDSAKSIDSIVKIDDGPARDALARLDILYKEIISSGSERIAKKLSTTLYSFLVIILFSIILFIILLIFIFYRLGLQVKAIGRVSKDMAEGDLSKEITIIPNDAIGDMAENFNLAIASLKKIIGGVVSTTNEGRNLNDTLSGKITQIEISSGEMSNNLDVIHEKIKEENNQIIEASSALEEISANTSSLSKQISMQAESVSTTSAAVEEMAASILNVARVADSRQNVTENLIKMTKEGSEKIEEANVIVQDAVKNMGAMQEMLEVINNITSQTNLLSMNAAIEAAHAGDAGKGFAVVADEIRKLAESTAENANEISDSLTGLINRINQTADVTKESGASFRKIETEVRNFVQAFAEISASTKELSEGSKEIQDSTISLLDITSNIKTGAKEMTLGANDINIALLRIKDVSDNNTSSMAS
jgi:methyl-accepting chemotaxis protein